MKVGLILEGYIPASATGIAEVPDDVTVDELDSMKDDLLVKHLEEDGLEEISYVSLGEIVPDHVEEEVRVIRRDGRLIVESAADSVDLAGGVQ